MDWIARRKTILTKPYHPSAYKSVLPLRFRVTTTASGQCGIPMVDEDGRPRPIKIRVDASTEVVGADNVVGHEEIIIGESRRRVQFNNELLNRPAKRRRDDGPSSSSS
uniref:Uncharacterized protein n=1 Tax=Photinus pyralis TaxID=7054 RepID=A0A1Y1N2U9_PHOPY